MHLKTARLTYLRRETSVADAALKRTFFRVTSVMNFQGGIASESFET
jgi:hypothetical protein